MTLDEKIGQMMVCPFRGDFVNRDSDSLKKLRDLIINKKIGGLILKGGEVYETAYLINSLQQIARIPLLMTSDLERGLGQQIDGTTLFPPHMSIGATGSEKWAYLMGKVTAIEARAIGLHMTFAPVVDVNINPENPIIDVRSFGEDPSQVSRLAVAFIKGCQEEGLIVTAKHFPGHGDTDKDSHNILPVVKSDRDHLEEIHHFPFMKAIEAGVHAIMTAHIWFPSLEPTPKLPASLSRAILTDLLRKDYGFRGLIVTDAMDMGAIATNFSLDEAVVKSIQAGVDVILQPPDIEEAIQSLVHSVKEGQISETRINATVRRILKVKAMLRLQNKRFVNVASLDEKLASKDHRMLAAQIFEHSLTLVKNKGEILPLDGEKQKIAIFSLSSDPGGYFAGYSFVQEMRKRCSEVFSFYAEPMTGQEYLQEALKRANEADVILFALFSRLRSWKGTVDLDSRHVQVIQEALKGSTPVVAISFGSPYFLRHFPDIDSYLCAYRYSREPQVAAARALFGEIDIQGRLPISIPGLYSLGHGLALLKKKNS
jgi:beta-N-acetylhexosaminidase